MLKKRTLTLKNRGTIASNNGKYIGIYSNYDGVVESDKMVKKVKYKNENADHKEEFIGIFDIDGNEVWKINKKGYIVTNLSNIDLEKGRNKTMYTTIDGIDWILTVPKSQVKYDFIKRKTQYKIACHNLTELWL